MILFLAKYCWFLFMADKDSSQFFDAPPFERWDLHSLGTWVGSVTALTRRIWWEFCCASLRAQALRDWQLLPLLSWNTHSWSPKLPWKSPWTLDCARKAMCQSSRPRGPAKPSLPAKPPGTWAQSSCTPRAAHLSASYHQGTSDNATGSRRISLSSHAETPGQQSSGI